MRRGRRDSGISSAREAIARPLQNKIRQALALGMSAVLSTPSPAQKGEVAATSAKNAELSRAGKYAQAIPPAQGQLESLERKYGLFNLDVAGALNNLALLYGDQGRDPRPSRSTCARRRSASKRLVPIIPTSQYPSTTWPPLIRAGGRNAAALPIVKRMIGSGAHSCVWRFRCCSPRSSDNRCQPRRRSMTRSMCFSMAPSRRPRPPQTSSRSGSRDPAHHRDVRPSQDRSENRPCRGAAAGDAVLS